MLKLTWRADLEDFEKLPWREPGPGGVYCPDMEDGAAQWARRDDGRIRALTYVCPCGCKDWRQIPVTPGSETGWAWNGDEETPTLTPSILHTLSEGSGNCGWHGYLTAGFWQTC
jgi:hypothetical protein